MKIALIQTALSWEQPAVNRQDFDTLFENIPSDTQLVVLPEMFTTGFSQSIQHAENENNTTLIWLQHNAQKLQTAIVGSLMIKENNQYYNRLYFVEPSGKTTHYDKKHLFTFAGEDNTFSSGNKIIEINYLGWKIRPFICYDLRFPKWLRTNADQPYDILLGVANWPKARINAWDCLLQARAIENICYTIGCNIVGTDGKNIEYCGHSAVYDYFGKRIVFAADEPKILTATLDKSKLIEARKKFPVLQDAD